MAEQTEIFFCSVGFGFLLGILYDVFRIFRLVISRAKSFVLFMDLLYFAVCSVLVFCFMLVTDSGRVRLYTAGGQLIGWLIYYFSSGAVVIRLTSSLTAFVRSINRRIFLRLKKIFAKVWRKTCRMRAAYKKIARKSDKKVKFNLQKYKHIVYNLYSYRKNRNYSEKEKNDGC